VDGSFVVTSGHGLASNLADKVLRRTKGAYPRGAHDFDKFKAFVALDLLPQLANASRDGPRKLSADGAVAKAIEGASQVDLGPGSAAGLSIQPTSGQPNVLLNYRQSVAFDPASSELARVESEGRVLTLAIVGHGAMIRKHCLAGATRAEASASGAGMSAEGRVEPQIRANNNAVYEKLFLVRRLTRGKEVGKEVSVTLSEAAGDCPVVMDAPSRADSMKRTEARDLQSCDKPFDVKPFLRVAQPREGPSACEAAADARGSFPILYPPSPMRGDLGGGPNLLFP